MSDECRRIEIVTGPERRRRWSATEKLRIVEETLTGADSVSAVARRHGVAPNLLYRWRRLMTEGGAIAVQADDSVTGNGEVRRMEGNRPVMAAPVGCRSGAADDGQDVGDGCHAHAA
jgi:transposase